MTEEKEIEQILLNNDYLNNREALLDQYKIYINSMNDVSSRRYHANSFFLTLNSILVTVLATLFNLSAEFSWSLLWSALPALAGIIFCFSWRRLIDSYRQLNRGKFEIIHLLEEHLPMRLFKAEWKALRHGDGTYYRPFTATEKWIPVIFAGIYCLILVATFLY